MKIQSAALLLFTLVAVAPPALAADPAPATLLQIVGIQVRPSTLAESALIIIDAQREYIDGKLPLAGIGAAVHETELLLKRARQTGTPVIHVVHRAKPGSPLFDPVGPYVEIVPELKPRDGETVVAKSLPNAFAGTSLEALFAKTGRKRLIVAGFMTHMCLSATVRAALDLGYKTTVVEGATATRDLPDGAGGIVSADAVQKAEIAALRDRFAAIVAHAGDVAER